MTYWNDIPWDANAEPAIKAKEFDAQLKENGGSNEDAFYVASYQYTR